MEISNLFAAKRKKYRVNLYQVARQLNISSNDIIGILDEAGFDVFNMPQVILNENHLEVLSIHYTESIKNFYNSISKNYHSLNQVEQDQFRRFFARFIKGNFSLWYSGTNDPSLEKVFHSKLDNALIKNFFYSLINTVNLEVSDYEFMFESVVLSNPNDSNNNENIYNKLKHKIKLKLKVKQAFNDIRSRLNNFLVSSHYHIFSDDEIDSVEVVAKSRFSGFNDNLREALKFINNLKFQQKWKILIT